MKPSARGYHWMLQVVRTIFDLAKADQIAKPHIAEALSYGRLTHMACCRCRSLRSSVAARCTRISPPSN
jgi:hypothetical protein